MGTGRRIRRLATAKRSRATAALNLRSQAPTNRLSSVAAGTVAQPNGCATISFYQRSRPALCAVNTPLPRSPPSGLPPNLVLALIQVESAFKADAMSSAGAVGLMQIMPFWVEELGLPIDDLTEPNRNLRYGCTILAHYLAVERGDFTRALARYNGSLGQTWYPERVLKTWRDYWR